MVILGGGVLTPPRRTLQYPPAWGPVVVLGGWVLLMSELPLYPLPDTSVSLVWGSGVGVQGLKSGGKESDIRI